MLYSEYNGTSHLINSGYLEVAQANDLIIVAPQALASLPENAIGCWDTYGIGGRLYGRFLSDREKIKTSLSSL